MNVKRYIFGLIHSVVAGALNAVLAQWIDPQHFSGNYKALGALAAWGAASAAYLYLQQPPRTSWTKEQRDAKRQTPA